METTIPDFKKFFKNSIAIAEEKGNERVSMDVPLKDLRILTEFLESMHFGEKIVATEVNKPDVVYKLADTVSGMTSADYKERFKAEYHQTKIRYEKLKAFNNRIEAAFETNYRKNAVKMPVFDCPQDMLKNQQKVMGEYLHILEVRAVIEGVDLTSI